MAQLAATEQALFYPTDVPVVQTFVEKHINFKHYKVHAFDPCVGDGVALAAFANVVKRQHRKIMTWGIELEKNRAELAKKVIDHVLHSPFENVKFNSVPDFIFMNPPYDMVNGERAEILWINMVAPLLTTGHSMLLVLPEMFFEGGKHHNKLRTTLYKNNLRLHGKYNNSYDEERVGAFKFPDPYYEKFKQYIVLVTKTYSPIMEKKIHVEGVVGEVKIKMDVSTTEASSPNNFSMIPLETVENTKSLIFEKKEALFGKPTSSIPVNPLQPMRDEIMAAMIAGGMFSGIKIDNLVVRGGTTVKTIKEINETDSSRETIETQSMTAHVSVLDINTGLITSYDSSTDEFGIYIEKIAKQVAELYKKENPSICLPEDIARLRLKFQDVHAPRAINGHANGLFENQVISAATIMRRWELNKSVIVIGEMGTGKGQRYSDIILTPTGWTTFGELHIGSEVIGVDGKPEKVIGLYPQGKRDFYRVTFSDGSWVDVTDNHLWEVQSTNDRFRGKPARVMETTELLRLGVKQSYNNRKWHIPMVEPVQFKSQEIPLDPYLVGALIGDGGLSTKSVIFTNDDPEIRQRIAHALPKDVYLQHISRYDFRITAGKNTNPVHQALVNLGLADCHSNDKFIPKSYLYNSMSVRVALLQGLLDTDGSVDHRKGTSIEYTSVSDVLIFDVKELVESLGGLAVLNWRIPKYKYNGEEKEGQKAYRLHISLPPEIQPFSTNRKLSKYQPRTKYPITRSIESIEPIGQEEAICIAVDHPRQLYVTREYIVTHNTITSIAATVGQVRYRKSDAQKIVVLLPSKDDIVNKWKEEIAKSCRDIPHKIYDIETITDTQKAFKQDGLTFILVKESMLKRSSPLARIEKVEKCFNCGSKNELVNVNGEIPENDNEYVYCNSCGVSYQTYVRSLQNTGDRKVKAYASIANYILKHYSKSYALIVDEAHQFKGGDSARGYASGSIIRGAWRALIMTGTFYNGYASSMYYLLYRAFGSFRENNSYEGVKDFVRLYGLEEKITKEIKKDPKYSFSGYNVNKAVRVKEIPGIHPSMIAIMLPFTVFMKLSDMNFFLPPKKEYTLFLDLPEEVSKKVNIYLGKIYDDAIEDMKNGNMSLKGQLTWAKAATHDIYPIGDEVGKHKLEPLQPEKLAPKEEALLRILSEKKAKGYPTLIYYIQTERRPIQNRLINLASQYGIKIDYMPSTEKNRVRFIEKALAGGADAVFCNANLVKEGIDLLQFKAIVWYGVTRDAFLVNQANFRIYRIGQTHEVEIYYLGYNKTYQAESWMDTAQKVAAMSAMHGDVRTGLAALLGEKSMISEVQNVMIEYEKFESDLTMSDLSDIINFTKMKPKAVSHQEDNWYDKMEQWKSKNNVVAAPASKKAKTPTAQPTLF